MRRVASLPVATSSNSAGQFNADFNLPDSETNPVLVGRIYGLITTSRYLDREICATLDVK